VSILFREFNRHLKRERLTNAKIYFTSGNNPVDRFIVRTGSNIADRCWLNRPSAEGTSVYTNASQFFQPIFKAVWRHTKRLFHGVCCEIVS